MTNEKVLVVGCGLKIRQGAVNLDCVPLSEIMRRVLVKDVHEAGLASMLPEDFKGGETWYVQFDLELIPKQPWQAVGGRLPFADNWFDYIHAEDVLEHLTGPIEVMQELGRVLKVGGRLFIRGPDWRYEETWSDLTHKRGFAPRTFDGFIKGTHDEREFGHYHGTVRFRAIERAKEVNHGLEWLLERLR